MFTANSRSSESALRRAQGGDRFPSVREREPGAERRRDDDIHRRAGERDPEFLGGLVGHPLQSRHAADGQERDVLGRNAVAPRHEGVAVFVQEHAAKQAEEEDHAVDRRRQASDRPSSGTGR